VVILIQALAVVQDELWCCGSPGCPAVVTVAAQRDVVNNSLCSAAWCHTTPCSVLYCVWLPLPC
jgi:hypothetical protein